MKTIYALFLICASAVISTAAVSNDDKGEQLRHIIKVRELNNRKENLKEQIMIEDAKRNQSQQGVAPETMELMNERQDSICLDLRSQLVSVELQLKELVPNGNIEDILQNYNALQQNTAQEAK